jgi:hypothetical protein
MQRIGRGQFFATTARALWWPMGFGAGWRASAGRSVPGDGALRHSGHRDGDRLLRHRRGALLTITFALVGIGTTLLGRDVMRRRT